MQNDQLQEKILIYEKNIPIRIELFSWAEPHRILKTHWHDYTEIIYFKSGKSTAIIGQNHLSVEKGDSLIINPNELHTLDMLEANTEYYVGLIDNEFLKSAYLPKNILFQCKIVKDQRIGSALKKIYSDYHNRTIGFDYRIKGEVYLLYSHLLENYLLVKSRRDDQHYHNRKIARLKVVLEYIEQNYMNTISCDELAGMLNISKSYFTHLFSETMHITVIDYINRIRIEKAYGILQNTELNVTQTASHLGFNDVNYFSRLFKKHYGYSPSHLLKNIY